ncbi:MAG: arginase [Gammaproteobacteria bacterium]|nr:arginase [Gammaproteobacteria bacterium]
MQNNEPYYVVGVASGLAARDSVAAEGPKVLRNSSFLPKKLPLEWVEILQPEPGTQVMQQVAALGQRLADIVDSLVSAKRRFLVLGGDHSCGVGTWSGAANALRPQGEIGLIWVDAHLDAHTPKTSESGNIHGMPVASLLGYGDQALTHLFNWAPKIKPEHLCYIGVREYEPAERALIEGLGVRVFWMEEVHQRGIYSVLQEAIKRVKLQTVAFGVSIDIDAIDPRDAPATGVTVSAGIEGDALCKAMQLLAAEPALLGVELAEFAPAYDKDNKTEKLIGELLACLNKVNEPLS